MLEEGLCVLDEQCTLDRGPRAVHHIAHDERHVDLSVEFEQLASEVLFDRRREQHKFDTGWKL